MTFCICIRICIVIVAHKRIVQKLLTLIVVPVKVGHLPSSAGGRICDIEILLIWGLITYLRSGRPLILGPGVQLIHHPYNKEICTAIFGTGAQY